MNIRDETSTDEHLSDHTRLCLMESWGEKVSPVKSRSQMVINPLLANWPAEDLEAFCGIYTVERRQELQGIREALI